MRSSHARPRPGGALLLALATCALLPATAAAKPAVKIKTVDVPTRGRRERLVVHAGHQAQEPVRQGRAPARERASACRAGRRLAPDRVAPRGEAEGRAHRDRRPEGEVPKQVDRRRLRHQGVRPVARHEGLRHGRHLADRRRRPAPPDLPARRARRTCRPRGPAGPPGPKALPVPPAVRGLTPIPRAASTSSCSRRRASRRTREYHASTPAGVAAIEALGKEQDFDVDVDRRLRRRLHRGEPQGVPRRRLPQHVGQRPDRGASSTRSSSTTRPAAASSPSTARSAPSPAGTS